jgi:predicted RNA-binding protein YlxR (DUF448 family)
MAAARRHVPLRTCIICGLKTEKSDLRRLVAQQAGSVVLDPAGRQPGRGAYVCSGGDCRSNGPKRGRVEYALRTRIGDDAWSALVAALAAESPTR